MSVDLAPLAARERVRDLELEGQEVADVPTDNRAVDPHAAVGRADAHTARRWRGQSNSRISKRLTPRGALKRTVSPTRDFISASPIGLLAVTSS